jgi:hypothetical protein
MARDWESIFRNWSKPSSDTEEQKCENAERMIRDAIRGSRSLSGRTIEIFPQGSYQNNTNVRQDSDVDICVRCMDVFFYEIPNEAGFTREDAGISDASYTYSQFKNEVEQALVAKFGSQAVRRGNKAFDVHASSYRVDADVVACFEHRRYTYRGQDGRYNYLSGTEFQPDNGGSIINWPIQNYENGIIKNKATGDRFKYITRILKRLRNEMEETGISSAEPIPSYLIECLVWNVPNERFGHDQYIDDARYALAYTFNETLSEDKCREWGEVNELKYLFRPSQSWTREQAHAFLDTAWNYIGFE